MLYIGSSDISFQEYRGNFRINNYEEQRLGLPDFQTVETTPSSETLQFSFGNVAVVRHLELRSDK